MLAASCTLVAAAAPPETATSDEARAGVQRGVEFLLREQNSDGSWGSKRNALLYQQLDEVFLTAETQRGWKVATTGLCCLALRNIEGAGELSDRVSAALDRGVDYVLANTDLKRSSEWDVDSTWGMVYGLQALAAMYSHGPYRGTARQPAIAGGVQALVGKLRDYQTTSGGWGYYDVEESKTRTTTWATSFMTGAAVIALLDARDAGFAVDDAVVARAIRAIERCRLPGGAFAYNVDPLPSNFAGESIDSIKGSLGRTQVCNLALLRYGKSVDERTIERAASDFFQHHRFLDIARGRPIPHEAYYANAAYFYLFGHHYAAGMIARLPPEQRQAAWPKLRRQVLKTQQSDGSMIDYYMNSYGKPYGTAFSLLALQESLRDEAPTERP